MNIGSLIKTREHGVRFMLDLEKDCLPQSEMTVPSMLSILVRSGSPNGVVGTGHQLIKMIGKLTHTYQRICSRSWTGRTWLFPSNKLDERRATIQAAVAHAKSQRFLSRGVEAAELMMEESQSIKKSRYMQCYPRLTQWTILKPERRPKIINRRCLSLLFQRTIIGVC